MWIRNVMVMSCALGVLVSQGKVPGGRRGFTTGLPTLPNSSLLIGLPPFFLVLTNSHEVVRLQPEYGQPPTQDATSLYPSISRDGKMIAYARVKANQSGRVLAIATYSVTSDKHTEYAAGEYSGSIAISPDASRLAYPGARPFRQGGQEGGDNHLHIIDLGTGQQIVGPEINSSPWPVFASWSPDSRQLAFAVSGEIRVWDSNTGKVSKVADGDLPAWSPSGEWIAYLPGIWQPELGRTVLSSGRWGPKCLIVHPDGTGRKTLLDLTHSKSSPRFFVEAPVWSPDSKTLLLNELDDVDKNTVTVHALDIGTLKLKTVFTKSYHVLGWARAD